MWTERDFGEDTMIILKQYYSIFNISTELIEAEWRIYTSVDNTIIGSDNGLSPVRHQAIICFNAGFLLIGPMGTAFIETLKA